MPHETLIVSEEGALCLITLNRPQALNALNARLWAELLEVLEGVDRSETLRVSVITGSDRAFAAGADVSEMAGMGAVEMYRGDYLAAESARFAALRKPVIAAVAGFALGGGCELAMMCDLIVAADTAKFGQPETNLGIIAGLGGTQRMTRAIGKAKAMDMHLTGRMMDAAEAERAGLVARVVPAAELMATAREMAGAIARRSLPSVMAAKEAINRSFETPLAEGLRAERRLFQSLFATEDQKEGMAAFLAKRPAAFKDR